MKVEIMMKRSLVKAADTVAGWDQKDRSEYVRGLITDDTRRRGALPRNEGEK